RCQVTAPEPLTLGQRVRFAATLRRTAQNAPREPGQLPAALAPIPDYDADKGFHGSMAVYVWPNRRMKVWKRGDDLGELNPGEGVVVGLRTLYDGFVD